MSAHDPIGMEKGEEGNKVFDNNSEKVMATGERDDSLDRPLFHHEDLLAKESNDLALEAKMHIVNNVR
jgi:hypothetical protein